MIFLNSIHWRFDNSLCWKTSLHHSTSFSGSSVCKSRAMSSLIWSYRRELSTITGNTYGGSLCKQGAEDSLIGLKTHLARLSLNTHSHCKPCLSQLLLITRMRWRHSNATTCAIWQRVDCTIIRRTKAKFYDTYEFRGRQWSSLWKVAVHFASEWSVGSCRWKV